MDIFSDSISLLRETNKLHQKDKTIGFVPTMGALHKGHLKLIEASKATNDITVVSIFVNPAQFAANEDLAKYPRPIARDQKLLTKAGVDYLFYPSSEQMYPQGFKTYVTVKNLSDKFEGKIRPGHFTGVSTIVLKLFNLIQPDNAYFGQKDFQQYVIVKKMVDDLNIRVNIHVIPTVRDDDGLALSSRNVYLNSKERQEASALYKSLQLAKKLLLQGETDKQSIMIETKKFLRDYKLIRLDYIEFLDSTNLVVLIAAHVGKTRLIDNIVIEL